MQLVFGHNDSYSTDSQIKTLWAFRPKLIEKHPKLDRVAITIPDDDDKNFYFIWRKIKREYSKKATFTWPKAKAAMVFLCVKQDVKPIMKKIQKLGVSKMLQTGKRSAAPNVREA